MQQVNTSTQSQQQQQPPPQHFLLKWNNHRPNLISLLSSLYNSSTLTDCTLLTPDSPTPLAAHRIILSACSPYFHTLFTTPTITPDKNPVIIFNDIKYQHLKTLLEFMYRGEISIDERELGDVLRVAEGLCVKGLSNSGGGGGNRNSSFGGGGNGNATEEHDNEDDEEDEKCSEVGGSGGSGEDEASGNGNGNQSMMKHHSHETIHSSHEHFSEEEDVESGSTTPIGIMGNGQSVAVESTSKPLNSHNPVVQNVNVNQANLTSTMQIPVVKRKRGRQPKIKTEVIGNLGGQNAGASQTITPSPTLKPLKPKKSATIKPRIKQEPTNGNDSSMSQSQIQQTPTNSIHFGRKNEESSSNHHQSPVVKRRKYNTGKAMKLLNSGGTLSKKNMKSVSVDTSTDHLQNELNNSTGAGSGTPSTSTNPLTEMSVRGLNLFRYASIIDNLYHCTECWKLNIKKSFKNKYSFQRHAFLYHEGNSRKVFPCGICGREFSRPDKMKNHLKAVHFKKGEGTGGDEGGNGNGTDSLVELEASSSISSSGEVNSPGIDN